MTSATLARPAGLARALGRGLDYLLELQAADGSWTDFWLAVGASDAWATGFVGVSVSEAAACPALPEPLRRAAATAAARAADWLLAQLGRRGGWGYNATVAPDGDSTAWAVSLLTRAGRPVPPEALALLERYRVPGAGVRTYLRADPEHPWAQPCLDVAASALRARFEAGALGRPELAAAWRQDFARAADGSGWWSGYWWASPAYPTALALELWRLAGRPPPVRQPRLPLATGSAFDRAWAALAELLLAQAAQAAGRDHDGPAATASIATLIAEQEADGGWPQGRFLIVPTPTAAGGTVLAAPVGDTRRLLTTASALFALTRAVATVPRVASARGQRRRAPPARTAPIGRRAQRLVGAAARAVGFGEADAAAAVSLFGALTTETFAEPCPWPSPQLSSLAAGAPLEFSVVMGSRVEPSLRYTVEVGHARLPAPERAASAVAATGRVAHLLGYDAAWQRAAEAISHATHPSLQVPDSCRFWVWTGLDQALDREGRVRPAVLKLYLSLLEAECGSGRWRLEQMLSAARIPRSEQLAGALDALDQVGFPHEVGFGFGPEGRLGCKVYYELRGWRRTLVSDLLQQVGISTGVDALRPSIPRLLGESLAAKSRAGVALRIATDQGTVRELTTAAAFPPPLVGHAEMGRRVEAWAGREGWRHDSYRALRDLLLPEWECRGPGGALHSLFTRTVSATSSSTSIYLRLAELAPRY